MRGCVLGHAVILFELMPHRSLGLQESEAPRYPDNLYMKVVGLSVLLTGSIHPAEQISLELKRIGL
jgi:hypothetical protein